MARGSVNELDLQSGAELYQRPGISKTLNMHCA